MFELTPYQWRGRTYKTVSGLFRAVAKTYPHASMSFGETEMHVKVKRSEEGQMRDRMNSCAVRTHTTYVFDVTRGPINIICDQPKATV